MNGVQEQVLNAVNDGATTITAIGEATGLEVPQIYGAMHFLKKAGKVEKGDGGYAIPDGAPSETATPAKRDPEATPPPRRATRSKRRLPAAVAAVVKPPRVEAAAVTAPVEFARFGEYLVLKKQDVVDLLLTLERWRQMVETVTA